MSTTERRIVTHLITTLLANGYRLNVNNGTGHILPSYSSALPDLLAALGHCDEEVIWTKLGDEPMGGILLIYGNGVDVISDYPLSMSELIDPILDAV